MAMSRLIATFFFVLLSQQIFADWTYQSLANTPFQELYSGADGYYTINSTKETIENAPTIFLFTKSLPKNWEPTTDKEGWKKLLSLFEALDDKTIVKDFLVKLKDPENEGYQFYLNYMPFADRAFQSAGILYVSDGKAILHIYDRSGKDFSKYIRLVEDFFAIQVTKTRAKGKAELKNRQRPLISSNRARPSSSL